MAQMSGKLTAAVAAIGVATGFGGARALDALTAPTPERAAPVLVREQGVVEALGLATKALETSVDLNLALQRRGFEDSLSPTTLDMARKSGALPAPTSEEVTALMVSLSKEASELDDKVKVVSLKYKTDEWAALVGGIRK